MQLSSLQLDRAELGFLVRFGLLRYERFIFDAVRFGSFELVWVGLYAVRTSLMVYGAKRGGQVFGSFCSVHCGALLPAESLACHVTALGCCNHRDGRLLQEFILQVAAFYSAKVLLTSPHALHLVHHFGAGMLWRDAESLSCAAVLPMMLFAPLSLQQIRHTSYQRTLGWLLGEAGVT